MILLADGNLLAASVLTGHPFHSTARRWFEQLTDQFATCSVTQGTLLRLHMRFAMDKRAGAAWKALAGIEAHPFHTYLHDDLPYREVSPDSIQGHRQVTDAWLVELAERHHGRVATFDQGMAVTYPDITVLL